MVLLTLLLAVIATIAFGEPASGIPDARQTGPGGSPLSGDQERDLAFLASVLENPAIDAATRTGAAVRMLRTGLPPAMVSLERALRGDDVAAMLAVINALGEVSDPVPELLAPAVYALRKAPPDIRDRLAIVLAKSEEAALSRIMALAADDSVPVAERLGAIHALGAFPTRESGDLLIDLANPRHEDDPTLRTAALACLRRLAPADLGSDFAAWQRWWNEVRDKSQEKWARELVRQYQDRTAELERSNDELAGRYVELLRELYRTLEVSAGQLERLPRDLDDPLGPVRGFAMDRIARLLRDSVPIPDDLREKLAERLDDPRPALRLQAAELLDELDDPEFATRLAARLPAEPEQRVAVGLLRLLARHPSPVALAAMNARLGDPALGSTAAEAIWSLTQTTALAAADRERTRLAVVAVIDAETTPAAAQPAMTRLLAYLGNDTDYARVEPMLDHDDAAIRRAVAEGIHARGGRQPLLDRADDDAIYPSALRSLVEGPPDLASFQTLVALRPPAGMADAWQDSVRQLATRLDPALLLDADQALARADDADVTLRTVVLSPAAVLPPDALPPEDRIELLLRLTPLLIEQGEALRAFEILESLNGAAAMPRLAQAKFRAAVMAGRYEAAAQHDATPARWVEILTEVVIRDATDPAAMRLRDEIARRFTTLGAVKTAFDAASSKVESPAAAVEATTNDPPRGSPGGSPLPPPGSSPPSDPSAADEDT